MSENFAGNLKWTPWSPREELKPDFYIEDTRLKISAGNNPNVYGKFLSGEISVPDLDIITFEVSFSYENIKNTENSIFAMLSFYDCKNTMLERDYADITKTGEKNPQKFYKKLDAPKNAAYVILEMGVRWCPEGSAEFYNITLKASKKADEPQRTVKIATTYKQRRATRSENLKSMVDIIDKAGRSSPDVILLSELVYESCYDAGSNKKAQPIPGQLTDIIGGYAKKYNTYIIFTMNEKDGDAIYNSAVIIGRDGAVCGKYRKTHLPLTEAEEGTSPGDGHIVFDLDFGRVGILICYDQYFPENWRTLALMGAEMIFIPTMGEDELIQRAFARANGVYAVVSGYEGANSSRIINPLGEIINFVKDEDTAYAAGQIDLNKRFFCYWMSIGPGNGETKSLFKKERMVGVYSG